MSFECTRSVLADVTAHALSRTSFNLQHRSHTHLLLHATTHNNLQGIDMSKSRGPTPLVRRNVLCIILHLITLSAGHHKLEPASIMTALALVMDTGESEGGRSVRSSFNRKFLHKVLQERRVLAPTSSLFLVQLPAPAAA
jgi:hypothetical protein